MRATPSCACLVHEPTVGSVPTADVSTHAATSPCSRREIILTMRCSLQCAAVAAALTVSLTSSNSAVLSIGSISGPACGSTSGASRASRTLPRYTRSALSSQCSAGFACELPRASRANGLRVDLHATVGGLGLPSRSAWCRRRRVKHLSPGALDERGPAGGVKVRCLLQQARIPKMG
jgi:hypothetical protein